MGDAQSAQYKRGPLCGLQSKRFALYGGEENRRRGFNGHRGNWSRLDGSLALPRKSRSRAAVQKAGGFEDVGLLHLAQIAGGVFERLPLGVRLAKFSGQQRGVARFQ